MEPAFTPNQESSKIPILHEEYNISFLQNGKGCYSLKVFKDLAKSHYERDILFKDLENEDPIWRQVENETQFQDLILSNINCKSIESKLEKNQNLILHFVIVSADKKFKIRFPLTLEKKDRDLPQLFDIFGNYILKLERKVDLALKDISTRFTELESRLEVKNKEFLNSYIEKDEKKRKEELENDKKEYNLMRMEICKDVSFLTILKSTTQNAKNDDVEYLFKPFLPAQNNNQHATLSNGNYSYSKSGGSWFRMKTEGINKEGKFIFSVRMDSYSAVYMIGFCLSNNVNINEGTGYYGTNQSFMFHISTPNFYNKGSATAYACVTFGPQIDANGIQMSIPKPLNLNDNEKVYLAPCVDIAGIGTTLTMVDFREISR